MKTGLTLPELAERIRADRDDKEDLIADTRATRLILLDPETSQEEDGETQMPRPRVSLALGDDRRFDPTPLFHRQMGSFLKIPAKYYDRMLQEDPELLATNTNRWLGRVEDRRMVRCLRGNARAYLSNRYRRLDNWDVAESVLPVLSEIPEIRVESANVTETRMYIKAVFPRVQAEVKPGDVVQAGVTISNSEVGFASTSVQPLIYRLVCSNGMVVNDAAARRYHIGKNTGGEGEDVYALFSDETLKQDDKAFLMKLEDTVRGILNEEKFGAIVRRMQEASEHKIEKSPVEAVELLSNQFQLQNKEKESVLTHLLQGNDLSKWGMVNAVTRASQDVEDYDRASELERFGGQVLDMSAANWKTVALN